MAKTNNGNGKHPPSNTGDLPRISDSEWLVMRVVWEQAPMTANQVVDALDGQADWKPKTIHTLLKRLVQKGALGFERNGREYVYHPLVGAQDCMQAASQSFLERVFDGDVAPFLACFMEQESLSPKEISELKRILEGAKK